MKNEIKITQLFITTEDTLHLITLHIHAALSGYVKCLSSKEIA